MAKGSVCIDCTPSLTGIQVAERPRSTIGFSRTSGQTTFPTSIQNAVEFFSDNELQLFGYD